MATFLFDNIIFGPVKSRRLGNSLGINLLPTDAKICNFNCIYCECGFNTFKKEKSFPTIKEFSKHLEIALKKYSIEGKKINTITFAGNGEPTLHPNFSEIIDCTIKLRNLYCRKAKIAVLSNSILINKQKIYNALLKIDYNILKLDSAITSTINQINRPIIKIDADKLIENLKKFNGKLIIQTLFLKGEYNSKKIDNTLNEEIEKWLIALKKIKPKSVMIYSIERDTPVKGLVKMPKEKLDEIAEMVKKIGITTNVY